MPLFSNDWERLQAEFVVSALDMLVTLPPQQVVPAGSIFLYTTFDSELRLVTSMRKMLCDAELFRVLGVDAGSLLTATWQRVERSGVLEERKLGVEAKGLKASVKVSRDAAAAEAAVRGLHDCALDGCASREIHVAQFKKCAACQQAFYCSREHQLERWPAHKAACKAARKASAPKTDL